MTEDEVIVKDHLINNIDTFQEYSPEEIVKKYSSCIPIIESTSRVKICLDKSPDEMDCLLNILTTIYN